MTDAMRRWAKEASREMTNDQREMLKAANRGIYIHPDSRFLLFTPCGRRTVVHTWAGGLRRDHQHVTAHGRALLELWGDDEGPEDTRP